MSSWLARARGADGEAGQVMLLSLCFALVCLLLVTVVASATSVHLERKRLAALADSLALAAADELDLEVYFDGGVPEPDEHGKIFLTDASVAAAVEEHLSAWPAQSLPDGVVVERAWTPDGRTAEVTLRATARPVLLTWVLAPWSDGIALHARSSARAW